MEITLVKQVFVMDRIEVREASAVSLCVREIEEVAPKKPKGKSSL